MKIRVTHEDKDRLVSCSYAMIATGALKSKYPNIYIHIDHDHSISGPHLQWAVQLSISKENWAKKIMMRVQEKKGNGPW